MTDRYAVLGNPVEHSLSPLIHSHFAKVTGQDLSYERILVPQGKFEEIAGEFFAQGGLGCNITVPCKIDALNYAKANGDLSENAQTVQAVNTLKHQDGKVYGENTDGGGLCFDLKRLQCPLTGSNLLLIGAGGAARGILRALLQEGALSIAICNRTFEKALELVRMTKDERVTALPFDKLEGRFEVIINASSSSLHKTLPPVADEICKEALFAYDLMYTPQGKTVFTEHFARWGVKACDGLGMLVSQAALSFKLWRDVMPDIEQTLDYLRKDVLK